MAVSHSTDSSKKPLISIGLTTYDRMDLLKETLQTLINQTFTDFEILIGNDNPSRTINGEILGVQDKRIRYLNHSKNLGNWQNMDVLLEQSQGQYFTVLADDDLFSTNFLAALFEALEQFDYPTCAFTSYTEIRENFDPSQRISKSAQLLTGKEFLQGVLEHSIRVMPACGVYRKTYLQELGGMIQLRQAYHSDTLLAIRTGVLVEHIAFVDEPLIYYRDHEGSVSSSNTNFQGTQDAQEELCERAIKLLAQEEYRDIFQPCLYGLLRIQCLGGFLGLLYRNDKLDMRALIHYLHFLRKYIFLLEGTYRYKMMNETFMKTTRLVLSFAKRKIIK